jgi:uncharacterized protein YbjT (DUF2867 family)
MNILILGAAGKMGRMLTNELLKKTTHQLVLYARDGHKRLNISNNQRVVVIDGDFKDKNKLIEAMKDIDLVYVNDMGDENSTATIIGAMNITGVKRVITASVLGIYDEVHGAFGEWNNSMIGINSSVGSRMKSQIESARLIEDSNLDYTILRISWLYNQEGNTRYMLTQKGETFKGTQVTRQAVVQLIMDVIEEKREHYLKVSIGVSEPDTDWDKPSFF